MPHVHIVYDGEDILPVLVTTDLTRATAARDKLIAAGVTGAYMLGWLGVSEQPVSYATAPDSLIQF